MCSLISERSVFSNVTRSQDCVTTSVYALVTFIPLSPVTRQTRVWARLPSLVFSHFKEFLILCKCVINYSYRSQGFYLSHSLAKILGPQALATVDPVYSGGDSSVPLVWHFLSSTEKTCPQRTFSSLWSQRAFIVLIAIQSITDTFSVVCVFNRTILSSKSTRKKHTRGKDISKLKYIYIRCKKSGRGLGTNRTLRSKFVGWKE